VTLPKDVIAALEAIDEDISRAVVRLTQPELAKMPRPSVDLAMFGRRAVIVVNPTRTLEFRTGVVLVPLTDGRALIAFDDSITPAGLELMIQDELEDDDLAAEDRLIFEEIRRLLKEARQSSTVSIQQRNIIVLEHVEERGARGSAPDHGKTQRRKAERQESA
jgi:CRP-like cAMP-binding protein